MIDASQSAMAMFAVVAAVILGRHSRPADEGMWLFNNLPLKQLKEKYGFEPTARVARAPAAVGRAVQQRRLGLVRLGRRPGDDQPPRRRRHAPEDQHDGEGLLQGRASCAKTHAEEVKAPDLELNVLVDIEDVTDRVNAAVKPGMDDAGGRRSPAARR